MLELLNVIAQDIGKKALVFDSFDIFSEQGKPSYKKGEAIKFNVGLGAYFSMPEFSIFVNDQELAINKYGKAIYTTTAKTPGKNDYEVKISVMNPLTGRMDTFTKTYSLYSYRIVLTHLKTKKHVAHYISIDEFFFPNELQ